ncbi:alcohol dehydrogenase [Poronia punctata]|nr:alcohol dehydrogenase [Poronia punctata]
MASQVPSPLPTTMRAIIQTAPATSSVETVPIPQIEQGTALVHVSASLVQSNLDNIYRAVLPHFRLPYPIIPGSFSIGRIAALAPDAAVLEVGQLVLVSTMIRARDDPNVGLVWGVMAGFTDAHTKLYDAMALKGHYAEYVRAPLENVFALDEARLFGSLGYTPGELVPLAASFIVYNALRIIGVRAGEHVVVTPATGHYSSAAVDVAVAIGARVVAASRNAAGLAKLRATYASQGLETVQLTGDAAVDTAAMKSFGPVHAVLEVSPPAATGSSNLAAAIAALSHGGRIALVGGRGDESIPVSYIQTMLNGLRIQGSWMYERQDVEAVIQLTEAGLLKFGKKAGHETVYEFGLDQLEEAIDTAVGKAGPGCVVYIKP